MVRTELDSVKSILDEVVRQTNQSSFIENDPISVPHQFTDLQDIEIAAFFSAMFSWGQRKTIINKANELMMLMDRAPYDFIMNHQPADLKRLEPFKHRTFQPVDLLYFIHFLNKFYSKNDTLEKAFRSDLTVEYSQKQALSDFHKMFFDDENALQRTKKHVSTPMAKSACKRLNMFLRWMVRSDDSGVDFGLWKTIPMSELMIPLDVHVGRVAEHFGLLKRKQRDWQATEELTKKLRLMNPKDPVLYDYALFGIGVSGINVY